MITKFQTGVEPQKSSNAILYVMVFAVMAYVAYNYVIRPELKKNEKTEQ
jgi:hypothetical protein